MSDVGMMQIPLVEEGEERPLLGERGGGKGKGKE